MNSCRLLIAMAALLSISSSYAREKAWRVFHVGESFTFRAPDGTSVSEIDRGPDGFDELIRGPLGKIQVAVGGSVGFKILEQNRVITIQAGAKYARRVRLSGRTAWIFRIPENIGGKRMFLSALAIEHQAGGNADLILVRELPSMADELRSIEQLYGSIRLHN